MNNKSTRAALSALTPFVCGAIVACLVALVGADIFGESTARLLGYELRIADALIGIALLAVAGLGAVTLAVIGCWGAAFFKSRRLLDRPSGK